MYRGRLYFGCCNSWFYCLDAGTGKLVWKYQTSGPIAGSYPAISQGLVFFGSWDTHFYALDLETGKLVWKFQTSLDYMSPVEVNPQIIDSTVSIPEGMAEEVKLEMERGEEIEEDYGSMSTSYLGSELEGMELDFRKYRTKSKYR